MRCGWSWPSRATVGGADGASVSLRRHGRLTTAAASDQTVSDMDADQYDTGEGPCVDASIEGRWFPASSVATETRWPAFTPRARALGIQAILSSPLLTSDGPVGALNIYSRTAEAFTPMDQSLASMFADETSAILGNAARRDTEGNTERRLAGALRSRHVIALAQGMIMQRDHIDENAASPPCSASRVGRASRCRTGPTTSWLPPRCSSSTTCPCRKEAIMSKASSNTLDAFRREARLSHNVLWMRYFELGGMSSAFQLDAYLHDALQPSRHEHDVIAQALNERFVELGGNHPVPYAEDDNDEGTEG